jgi:hypothetical protein
LYVPACRSIAISPARNSLSLFMAVVSPLSF